MRYGSVCSGVEAASLAWEPLGWEPQWFAEIEKFPAAVLNHHWPQVENLGDITDEEFIQRAGAIDVLVGGTPCQSFSVAGLRGGLGDDRGNLALRFCQIVDQLTPTWVVWENVPGVLSSNGGRDFGAILGALVECGYGCAYRILDAQYFGVAQRRRRVFVVGYLGDWRPPAAVLFERYSLLGHTAESAEKRQEAAGDVGGGVEETGPTHALTQRYDSGEDGTGRGVPLVPTLAAPLGSHQTGSGQRYDLDHETYVPEVCGAVSAKWAKGTGGPAGDEAYNLVTVNARGNSIQSKDQSLPLIQCFRQNQGSVYKDGIGPIRAASGDCGGGSEKILASTTKVRRLTPIECERLQGMPDNHTRIPWRGKPAEECPDGPRYKAIGNSMAVPVMRWIGQRIDQIDTLLRGSTPVAGGCNDTPKGVPSSNVRQPPAKVEKMEQGALFC